MNVSVKTLPPVVAPPKEVTIILSEHEASLLKLLANNVVFKSNYGHPNMTLVKNFQDCLYSALCTKGVLAPF